MTTGKTIALTRWTFVDKVMSLLFNMRSSLVITFFPKSKRLLISWLQSPSAVILEPPKIKSTSFHCFPIYLVLSRISLYPWKKQWHPTQLLLPGKSHGWRSLVGCSLWGCNESDTTKRLLSFFTFMHWRRKWQPTPVFLPGESQGRRSLVGCHLWGCTGLDTIEVT